MHICPNEIMLLLMAVPFVGWLVQRVRQLFNRGGSKCSHG